jgi:predicted RNase H-like HicB family nuclease
VTQHFPIVIEHEANGTWSAWVAGLPGVYAAADSLARVKRAIREAVTAHLDTLGEVGQQPRGRADVVVLRYDASEPSRQTRVRFVGLGALLGRTTSPAKAAAARRNGRKGGRPRHAVRRTAR